MFLLTPGAVHGQDLKTQSWKRRVFKFRNLKILSLLCANDMVLLASSGHGLQSVPGPLAAECKAAGMGVSSSKFEVMVSNGNLCQG